MVLLRALHGKSLCLVLIHAFRHEGVLVHLALLLGLLREVHQVAEVVLGVVSLLLFLLLLHWYERIGVVVLVIAEEPRSVPQIPHRRHKAECRDGEEVWL
jgi:hypothetical protein